MTAVPGPVVTSKEASRLCHSVHLAVLTPLSSGVPPISQYLEWRCCEHPDPHETHVKREFTATVLRGFDSEYFGRNSAVTSGVSKMSTGMTLGAMIMLTVSYAFMLHGQRQRPRRLDLRYRSNTLSERAKDATTARGKFTQSMRRSTALSGRNAQLQAELTRTQNQLDAFISLDNRAPANFEWVDHQYDQDKQALDQNSAVCSMSSAAQTIPTSTT